MSKARGLRGRFGHERRSVEGCAVFFQVQSGLLCPYAPMPAFVGPFCVFLKMRALLGLFLDIGFLSGRPQDLPASRTLPILTGILALLTNYAVDTGFAQNGQRFDFALAQTSLLGVWIAILLAVRHLWVRYGQTIAAVYGSNVLINLITWPLSFGRGFGAVGSQVLAIILAVWFVAIITKILRHALELPLFLSALMSLTGIIVSGWILITLFPLPQS